MTATDGEVVIDVADLRMSYEGFEAVQGIDLQVRRGEVFAFLGPNGAGKTTTVEIMEGYRRRTDGSVTVLGEDPESAGAAWRSQIGVVLQESEPERELTVSECLRLFAGYFPAPRDVEETLKLVGLAERADATASRLSGGQRRRLDVAMALIGDPELIFLDEPTTGFDPSARRDAWEMILGLRSTGVTVFLTTHYMEEAEFAQKLDQSGVYTDLTAISQRPVAVLETGVVEDTVFRKLIGPATRSPSFARETTRASPELRCGRRVPAATSMSALIHPRRHLQRLGKRLRIPFLGRSRS